MALPTAPFESALYLGSLIQVEPASVRLNLPYGGLASALSYLGLRIGRGEVGEFVLVEGEEHAILGRLTNVKLPEGERLSVEPSREVNNSPVNPVGTVQLLLSINLSSGKVIRGVPEHPRIGQYAYAAHPDLVKYAIEGREDDREHHVVLAHIPNSKTTLVTLPSSTLFGRHCAVLGTTGGGKSWTVARLLGEVARHKGKVILFDPSGEFHTLSKCICRHVYLGEMRGESKTDGKEFVSFPYKYLSESDLFAMLQPSAASQSPKLREALISLKLIKLAPDLERDGLMIKTNVAKASFYSALKTNAEDVRKPDADYDITKLPEQINEECVWPNGWENNPKVWGNYDDKSGGYCTPLVSRIDLMIKSNEMASIFAPGATPDLTKILGEFLEDDELSILRISMENLPFEHHTRELIANGLARYLLRKARNRDFREKPLLVALDEAHQFLNKSVGDEPNRFQLESFGLIAKEGRKHGLLTVISTQRPRDIPEDVLSQMGIFIVHRLINEKDQLVVERACGNLDASAAKFLPVLGQGEALLVGLDISMTMPVQILRPKHEPDSIDVPLW